MDEFKQDLEYFVSGEGRKDIDHVIDLRNRLLINPADLRISLSELVVFDIENLAFHYSPNRDFDGGSDIAYTLCTDHNGRLSKDMDVWLILDDWINYTESSLKEVYTFLEDHDVCLEDMRASIEARIVEICSKQYGESEE